MATTFNKRHGKKETTSLFLRMAIRYLSQRCSANTLLAHSNLFQKDFI
jgi:hypothetical protein